MVKVLGRVYLFIVLSMWKKKYLGVVAHKEPYYCPFSPQKYLSAPSATYSHCPCTYALEKSAPYIFNCLFSCLFFFFPPDRELQEAAECSLLSTASGRWWALNKYLLLSFPSLSVSLVLTISGNSELLSTHPQWPPDSASRLYLPLTFSCLFHSEKVVSGSCHFKTFDKNREKLSVVFFP